MSKDNSPLSIFPSLEPALNFVHLHGSKSYLSNRAIYISALSIILGIVAGFISKVLTSLIGLITNLSFYGNFSFQFSSPKHNTLGLAVIIVPIAGALIVGLMARYGSKGIRGHGIPEAMEQVLTNKSKIPPRLTFLKPLSAAISIGTGGPFGAEGPIIATGGALGSLIGQIFKTTADERKILLAAGAAGGMAATFGSPVSAILLAIELLLFEFKPRSFLPVALASISATAVRISIEGSNPIFQIPHLNPATNGALLTYFVLGAIIGFASVLVTKSVYFIEDMFDKLPIHWMWWPALGAIAVGVVGYFVPSTLGVGYDNIRDIIGGNITGTVLLILFTTKFVSWSISLGSGTSGGTLAPLFTIGGGLGASLALLTANFFPSLGIDSRMAALIGMAALFAGSSRAILTSIIFAFETTLQPNSILPLLACCSASYLVSLMLMKETIMTEKIARRGIRVPNEYTADLLDQVSVDEVFTSNVVSFRFEEKLASARDKILTGNIRFNSFPVVNTDRKVLGIISREELENLQNDDGSVIKDLLSGQLVVLLKKNSVKEAANMMAELDIHSIPVVEDLNSLQLCGIISRSDILKARKQKIDEAKQYEKTFNLYGQANK